MEAEQTITTSQSTPAVIEEPFGLSGVRQHIGRAVIWLCVIVSMVSLAFWYRSLTFRDMLYFRAMNSQLNIESTYGRLRIYTTPADTIAGRTDRSTWGYDGGPRGWQIVRDGWLPSFWKTVGFEFNPNPIEPSMDHGWWMRIKWYFVAGVAMLYPVLCVLLGFVRRRPYDDASTETT